MQAVGRSEELKSSGFLTEFLTQQDYKAFTLRVKAEEKNKWSRAIPDAVLEDGEANVAMIQNSSVFCSKMSAYVDSYQILYQEVIDITKEINEKSSDLAQTMGALSKALEQLSELSRMIKVDRQHDLYSWLSRMLNGTGQHISNTSELIKLYCGSHLKYHCSEHESMRELYQTRDQVKAAYMKKERQLFDKKERLFKQKDVTKWGCTAVSLDELQSKQEELFEHKEKAFKFMLTEESRVLSEQREELSFYTNQCLSEVRRVGLDNGNMLTDHFITMSQINCAYINQVSLRR